MNKRFLGTPRIWWLITGVLFLLGLVLVTPGIAGGLSGVAGVLLILTAIVLFAAAPMRYGDAAKRQRAGTRTAAKAPPPAPPVAAVAVPRPRPQIEGRDPSEV